MPYGGIALSSRGKVRGHRRTSQPTHHPRQPLSGSIGVRSRSSFRMARCLGQENEEEDSFEGNFLKVMISKS